MSEKAATIDDLMAEFKRADDYKQEFLLRKKRTTFPDDPAAWLDQYESIALKESRNLPDKANREDIRGKVIQQIRSARVALRKGDEEGLQILILVLMDNLKIIRRNLDKFAIFDYSETQSKKGKIGAESRWGKREEVNQIIERLAHKQDEIGAYLSAKKDLWSLFYSELDESRMSPRDTSGAEPKDNDRMSWADNELGMTFKAFENRISNARKPKNP